MDDNVKKKTEIENAEGLAPFPGGWQPEFIEKDEVYGHKSGRLFLKTRSARYAAARLD